MQIKLTIALAAGAFALTAVLASAGEMPAYGSKNFTTPGVAPSYFTNESGGVYARGPETAAVPDETDDTTAADVPFVNPGTGRHGKHSSGGKSGKSKGHGGSTQYVNSPSAKSTGTVSARGNASAGRSASSGKASGKGGSAGSGKSGTAKNAKAGAGQRAAAEPSTIPATLA